MKILIVYVLPSITSRPNIGMRAVRARLGEDGISLIEELRVRTAIGDLSYPAYENTRCNACYCMTRRVIIAIGWH